MHRVLRAASPTILGCSIFSARTCRAILRDKSCVVVVVRMFLLLVEVPTCSRVMQSLRSLMNTRKSPSGSAIATGPPAAWRCPPFATALSRYCDTARHISQLTPYSVKLQRWSSRRAASYNDHTQQLAWTVKVQPFIVASHLFRYFTLGSGRFSWHA